MKAWKEEYKEEYTKKRSAIITSFANPKVDVSLCAHTVDNVKPEGNRDA